MNCLNNGLSHGLNIGFGADAILKSRHQYQALNLTRTLTYALIPTLTRAANQSRASNSISSRGPQPNSEQRLHPSSARSPQSNPSHTMKQPAATTLLPSIASVVRASLPATWRMLGGFLLLFCCAINSAQAQQSPTPTETRQARPDEPGSAVTEATRLMKTGQHADAIITLDTALKLTPRDPRLRFTYGLVLADQGKPVEAIDVLTQLTQDFPELPEPFNNLAVLHAARGDLDKARFALENALRALPNYSLGHENLGDLYIRLAARSYEQANASDRANTAAQSKLTLTRDLLTRVAPATSSTNTPALRQ
jgi:predicted Zn-dependent protease